MNHAIHRLRRTRATQAFTLLAWAGGSIISGTMLWMVYRRDGAFATAVGIEFVAWGAVDCIFAVLGVRQTLQVKGLPTDDTTIERERDGRDKLISSLAFNHYLNIGYLALAGGLFAWGIYSRSTSLYGHGTGVLIQGGFLFVFDIVFLCRLRAERAGE